VVVDYGGPGELVSAETGVKVALGSHEEIVAALRAAVERLCGDPARVAALSASARSRAGRLFTWDAKAAQVEQVHDWVLGRRRAKPAFFNAPQELAA
jgi:glycosyltransferase involved in cell wall biosynthesis